MIIIKLGGTNGSGKTAIARALIEMTSAKPVIQQGRTIGYKSVGNGQTWAILGDYKPRCGGMDVVVGHDNKVARLEHFMRQKDVDVVFFESYLSGVSYKNFGEMSERTRRSTPWLYAFLDTPVDVCIKRVAMRQGKDPATYTPPLTLRAGHAKMQNAAQAATKAGHHVIWLDHKDSAVNLAARLVITATEIMKRSA